MRYFFSAKGFLNVLKWDCIYGDFHLHTLSSEIKLTLNFVTAMRLFSPKSIGSSSSAPAVC